MASISRSDVDQLDALPADTAGPGPLALSPRLYSADLAPTRAANRTWGRYSLFALWTNDVHNIANYSFAIGLFALGMSGAQILCAFALGALVIYGLMNLSGYMGQKTGLPYPVLCRISFGIHGAQIPALIRAVIAIAWFAAALSAAAGAAAFDADCSRARPDAIGGEGGAYTGRCTRSRNTATPITPTLSWRPVRAA